MNAVIRVLLALFAVSMAQGSKQAKTPPADQPETPAAPADEQDEQVATPVPATIAEAIDQVADGSRLVEGIDPEERAENLHKVSMAAKRGLLRLTTLYSNVADELCGLRAVILLPDGRKDWAGSSALYNAFATVAYESAFSDLGKADRKRVTDNVRNHIRLHALESAIRLHVAASVMLDGSPMFPASADIEAELADESDKLIAERIEAHNGTEAFNAAVRREYKSTQKDGKQGVSVPTKYQTVEDKKAAAGSGGGPGQGAPKSLDAVLKGVEGLKGVVHSMAVKGALRATSLVVSQLTSSGLNAIDGRPGIRDDFVRMNDLSTYAIKWLDGKTNEKDVESIASAFWGEDDTQAIQPTPDEQ